MEDRYTDGRLGWRSFEVHELGEKERYNRENRAVPTIPFRRKVNFFGAAFIKIFLNS